MATSTEGYAELRCKSNFSFLEGASHPEELVSQSKELGLSAVALTDRNGFYGIVRAHTAAKEASFPLVIGSELTLESEESIVLLAQSRKGYGHLSRLISIAHGRHEKGEAAINFDDLASHCSDLLALSPSPYSPNSTETLKEIFGENLSIALHRTLEASDRKRSQKALRLSRTLDVPIVATNDVHYHLSQRQRLQDALTATRHRTTVAKAGFRLFPNAERRLKSPQEMAKLFADLPGTLQRTIELSQSCHFSMDELRYNYPNEFLPPGKTTNEYLTELTWKGAAERYGSNVPKKVHQQLTHELKLIRELHFSDYFLTIHDIVTHARSLGILCQGRGSAANSAVCFVLGITAIDPVRMNLLFERFISAERGEPPDIDVDFEHERREEVIQYIYKRYGRERAGMVAEVICYRKRSALRDLSKTLGENHKEIPSLYKEIQGFPRHLSTHVGGFVLTQEPLIESVPIEKARMPNRTIIQWDKNDLDALGMLKVDILGLGMLTCIRKSFDLIESPTLSLETIPAEDPQVYDMICRADTVGVFQIESRAQMGMLPRLQPRTFHDLVIEVAIVRPGPIQGGMIHPYLARRRGEVPILYAHPALKPILEKTCGIPLFQEQVMKMAVAVADFSAGEADQLRRAMGIWRTSRSKSIASLGERFMGGMMKKGVSRKNAEAIFKQIQSFGEFGFPESHSASFALLVYASAYLKNYHPAPFACALLNSLPMGFYLPHTIIEDAKRHGVEVRPPDVLTSDWDSTLEGKSLRLGLRLVRGLSKRRAESVTFERSTKLFENIEDFFHRCSLTSLELFNLATADTFQSFGLDRRQAIWKIRSFFSQSVGILAGHPLPEPRVSFAKQSDPERVITDYQMLSLSTFTHPVSLLRERLNSLGAISSQNLPKESPNRPVRSGGMVIVRQRPPTAKGMVFLTLEDETGFINVAIRPNRYEALANVVFGHPFLLVEGKLQKDGLATSLLVTKAWPLTLGESDFPATDRNYFRGGQKGSEASPKNSRPEQKG